MAEHKFVYFPVIGRGFPAALAMETSGLAYKGEFPSESTDLGEVFAAWGKMKPSTPLGKLPVLDVPGYGGVGQTYAIMNYLGRKAPDALPTADEQEYAVSQQLVYAIEDIMNLLFKDQDTPVKDPKASDETITKLWAEKIPQSIGYLETFMQTCGKGPDRYTKAGMSIGEIVVFGGLHRLRLLEPQVLDQTPGLKAFMERMTAAAPIAKMLECGGSMPRAFGPLWFQARGIEKTGKLPEPQTVGKPASGPMKLTYFPVFAKGLLPALALEVSGADWVGAFPSKPEEPTKLDFAAWGAMKPKTNFGQLPMLEVDGVGQISQALAIANYIAHKNPALAGEDDGDFITSQQLLHEVEDLWDTAQKTQQTVFRAAFCSKEETEKAWTESFPQVLGLLEALMKRRGKGDDRFTSSGVTVGELQFFAVCMQMKLVRDNVLDAFPGLKNCYARLAADARIKKVVETGGKMPAAFGQYLIARTD